MEDKSEISYWFEDDNILTFETTKVPTVGEEIFIDTRMDKEWHDANFPTDAKLNFFNEGVRGTFVVTDVKRYYNSYDYKKETNFGIEGGKTYVVPAQRTVETFEVYLEKKD